MHLQFLMQNNIGLNISEEPRKSKLVHSVRNYCRLVRGSLFIELGCPRDLGKGWRGDLGTFMISRPI